MTQKQIEKYIRQAFSQCEGWTEGGLVDWIMDGEPEDERGYVGAVVEAYLPRHYYAGKRALHASQKTVWYTRRREERERRMYPEPSRAS